MGCILVDLDGTLAEYNHWKGPHDIGAPIPKMVDRIKRWLDKGKDVRIFTARVFPLGLNHAELVGSDEFPTYDYLSVRLLEAKQSKQAIEEWCLCHFGKILPIVCWKSFKAFEVWDDRAVQVIPNTGERVDGQE